MLGLILTLALVYVCQAAPHGHDAHADPATPRQHTGHAEHAGHSHEHHGPEEEQGDAAHHHHELTQHLDFHAAPLLDREPDDREDTPLLPAMTGTAPDAPAQRHYRSAWSEPPAPEPITAVAGPRAPPCMD